MNENIVFIGFMGTGKTSAGKLVSEKLQLGFIDIDEEIKKRCSMNIGEIFEQYGEKYFRCMEEDIVEELSSVKNCVISTGGGIVLNPKNISLLRENGIVFWLKASVDKILDNVKNEDSQMKDRPLLKAENIHERVVQLLRERETYYTRSCDYTICIDGIPLPEVTNRCVHLYHLSQGKQAVALI